MSWGAGKFDKFEKQIEMKTFTCYNDKMNKYEYRTDGTDLYINNELQRSNTVETQEGKLVFLVTNRVAGIVMETYINFEKKISIFVYTAKSKLVNSYTRNYSCY
jgi:hypothetical protein